MEQFIEFISNHPFLATMFGLLLLMFLWNLFTSLLQSKFMLTPDKVVYHINHNKAQLLDIRSKAEYDRGRIDGAVLAGVDASGAGDVAGKIKGDKDNHIILCGEPTLALKCLRRLQVGGYGNVFCLKGGVTAWVEAGLPLVKDG